MRRSRSALSAATRSTLASPRGTTRLLSTSTSDPSPAAPAAYLKKRRKFDLEVVAVSSGVPLAVGASDMQMKDAVAHWMERRKGLKGKRRIPAPVIAKAPSAAAGVPVDHAMKLDANEAIEALGVSGDDSFIYDVVSADDTAMEAWNERRGRGLPVSEASLERVSEFEFVDLSERVSDLPGFDLEEQARGVRQLCAAGIATELPLGEKSVWSVTNRLKYLDMPEGHERSVSQMLAHTLDTVISRKYSARTTYEEATAARVRDGAMGESEMHLLVRPAIKELLDDVFGERVTPAAATVAGYPHDDGERGVYRLIDGERGTGKSAALAVAVAKARAEGWIALFQPRASDNLLERKLVEAGTGGPLPGNLSKTHFVDGEPLYHQPRAIAKILADVKAHHGDALKNMAQLKTYSHDLYVGKKKSTLYTILARGLAEPQSAGDALVDLRDELCAQSEVPVLIAADEINACYWPTHIFSFGKRVDPERLTLNAVFRGLDPKTGDVDVRPARGAVIGATTRRYIHPPDLSIVRIAKNEDFVYRVPKLLADFNPNKRSEIDAGINKHVTKPAAVYLRKEFANYTQRELAQMLSYYLSRHVLLSASTMMQSEFMEFSYLTGNNPLKVWRKAVAAQPPPDEFE